VRPLGAVVCAGGASAHAGARPWGSFVKGQPGVYAPPASSKPEDVVVFLYTSGTTGFPKGAMCTHAGLLSNVVAEGALYGMGAEDVFGCVLAMFDTFALLDTGRLPLCLGATVAIGEPEDTESLLRLVEQHQVTFLATMPAQLTEMACGEFARPYDTSSLRMVQTGGAPLATEVWRKFRARSGLPILEGYGCSEASSTVTVMPPEGPYKPASVGKVMPNQEVRIVDDEGDDLPPGAEGEVVVRGPNVFAG